MHSGDGLVLLPDSRDGRQLVLLLTLSVEPSLWAWMVLTLSVEPSLNVREELASGCY